MKKTVWKDAGNALSPTLLLLLAALSPLRAAHALEAVDCGGDDDEEGDCGGDGGGGGGGFPERPEIEPGGGGSERPPSEPTPPPPDVTLPPVIITADGPQPDGDSESEPLPEFPKLPPPNCPDDCLDWTVVRATAPTSPAVQRLPFYAIKAEADMCHSLAALAGPRDLVRNTTSQSPADVRATAANAMWAMSQQRLELTQGLTSWPRTIRYGLSNGIWVTITYSDGGTELYQFRVTTAAGQELTQVDEPGALVQGDGVSQCPTER